MSNIAIKSGPFFHKGGWIAFTSKADSVGWEQPQGWYVYVEGRELGILTLFSAGKGGPYASEKLANKAFESLNRRFKWMKIWQAALENMPDDFDLSVKVNRWIKQPKGATTLPAFVVGNANDDMKSEGGFIYKRTVTQHTVKAAKIALLARIMGYTYPDKVTGRVKVNSIGFYHARTDGVRPRDPNDQKKLLRLASAEGKNYAIQLARKL